MDNPTDSESSCAELASTPRLVLANGRCDVCAEPINLLRAPAVSYVSSRFHYFCSRECRDRFREVALTGQQTQVASTQVAVTHLNPRPDITLLNLKLTTPSEPPSAPQLQRSAAQTRVLFGGLGVVLLNVTGAVTLSLTVEQRWAAGVASALLFCTLGFVYHWGRRTLKTKDYALWGLGALGAALAIVSWTLLATQSLSAGAPLSSVFVGSIAGAALAVVLLAARLLLEGRNAHYLEMSIDALRVATAKRAKVVSARTPNGETQVTERPLDSIQISERLLIVAGERVPLDGKVSQGEGVILPHAFAESTLRVSAGSYVIGGAQLLEGELQVECLSSPLERTTPRPSKLLEQVMASSTLLGKLLRAQRFDVKLVLGLGVLTLVANVSQPLPALLSILAAVLLSLPLFSLKRFCRDPLWVALSMAERRGCIFSDAQSLDRAGNVTMVGLCTQGALYDEQVHVVDVILLGTSDLHSILALTHATQSLAPKHPVASALVRFAQSKGVAPAEIRRSDVYPGMGMRATSEQGDTVVVGNRRLLLSEGVSMARIEERVNSEESAAKSVIFFARAGQVQAIFVLQYKARPGALAAIQRLMDLRYTPLMLTGDHRTLSEANARQLDLVHVKADLSRRERGIEVQNMREGGEVVAVMGVREFDEEALWAADVPIAHVDNGFLPRGITLATKDLGDLVSALWLARQAVRSRAQTALMILAASGALALAAMGGLITPIVAVLACLCLDVFSLTAIERMLRQAQHILKPGMQKAGEDVQARDSASLQAKALDISHSPVSSA